MKFHYYHLVNKSIWPLLWSINLLNSLLFTVLFLKRIKIKKWLILLLIINLNICIYNWIKSIINESTYNGDHNIQVVFNLLFATITFILSEIMLFFGLFWSYFHYYFLPHIHLGRIFPSYNITYLNPYEIPSVNTLLLLSAATLVSVAHHEVICTNYIDNYKNTAQFYIKSLFCLILGNLLIVVFIYLQYIEYTMTPFDISDSVFATTFFMATTFHGLHVLIACIWITILLIRFIFQHNTEINHTNLNTSLWYFHFTDIVWIILFTAYYILTF